MTMLESRTYRVVGRVQGVGFRWFTYDAARREGLVGVVGNEPDGSVEVMVEGDRMALERFEAAIRRGPAGARVDAVDREIGPASGHYADFSIRG
ncbi:MAG: acylphosphatase [Acidobacteria bacterium]|nr:acylphosphatase [Acidobacteriota bacterium]